MAKDPPECCSHSREIDSCVDFAPRELRSLGRAPFPVWVPPSPSRKEKAEFHPWFSNWVPWNPVGASESFHQHAGNIYFSPGGIYIEHSLGEKITDT